MHLRIAFCAHLFLFVHLFRNTAFWALRIQAADIEGEDDIDHTKCNESNKILQACCTKCGKVHSKMQTGIQNTRFVRDRFDSASIASPIWHRKGCICAEIRAKHAIDVYQFVSMQSGGQKQNHPGAQFVAEEQRVCARRDSTIIRFSRSESSNLPKSKFSPGSKQCKR